MLYQAPLKINVIPDIWRYTNKCNHYFVIIVIITRKKNSDKNGINNNTDGGGDDDDDGDRSSISCYMNTIIYGSAL